MRKLRTALVLAASVVLTIALAQPSRADLSFDVAYSSLSDHGSWVVSAQYGHVWQPREYNRQWSPYYDGHWVYTDMGWAWVSDYSWGAIPYHYGTWVDDPRVGWVWIPGRIWAPAWVVFRTSPDYIGWAPVPPGYSVGVSINMGAPSSFVFVSSRDFLAPRLRSSIVTSERTNVFINNTTVVNNIVIQNNVVINRGPDFRTIERATGATIHAASIETVTRVAPYQNVSRAQLAVAPELSKRGNLRVAEPVPASQPLPVSSRKSGPSAVAPTHGNGARPQVAPVTPSKQTEVKGKPNAPPKAKDDQRAQTQPATAVQQPHPKKQSDTATQPPPAKAKSDAAAQQPPTKAKADPKAKADSKPKPGEKAKKDEPEKKDKADEGTNDEPKKQSDR